MGRASLGLVGLVSSARGVLVLKLRFGDEGHQASPKKAARAGAGNSAPLTAACCSTLQ